MTLLHVIRDLSRGCSEFMSSGFEDLVAGSRPKGFKDQGLYLEGAHRE